MSKKAKSEKESLFDRVETVKQMGLVGGVEQLEELIELSQSDDSPAVRLRAAEGAAHVLSRLRVGESRELLPVSRRRQLLDRFRTVDPVSNPGLFPFLACLDLPRCLPRILVGLRDPRYDVRLAAVLGLRRYCASWSVSGDEGAQKKVLSAFTDHRMQPDVLASLSELVASCGWQSGRPSLDKLVGRDDQAGFAAEAAIEVLDKLASVDGLNGIWVSTGFDAGEVGSESRSETWWLLSEGSGALVSEVDGLTLFVWSPLTPTEIEWSVGGKNVRQSVRRLWLSRDGGDSAGPVLQATEKTYYLAEAPDRLRLAETLMNLKGLKKAERSAAFSLVEPALEGGSKEKKALEALKTWVSSRGGSSKNKKA